MKTKGLNFLEAVQAMKEGKKVTRPHLSFGQYYHIKKGETTVKFVTNNKEDYMILSFQSVDANDWEIVEGDSYWNLADNKSPAINDNGYGLPEYYPPASVKKCRDLILKDFEMLDKKRETITTKSFENVVKKRFGALE